MGRNTNSSSSMEGENKGGNHDGNIPNPRRPRSEENRHARNPPRPPAPLPQCPRCFSDDTKFCYYNNYNLAQPRYYCRACRRYWTQGGALRNVPVGGGGRRGFRPYGTVLRPPVQLPPPPRQPTIDYVESRRLIPYRVTNMAGLVSGISPITGSSGSIPWLSSMPNMDSIYPCEIFSVIEALEMGQFGQNKSGGPPRPPAQPPLRIHDQPPPPREAPKPADQGDGGDSRRKGKQPMYPTDESVVALPASFNNVASSSTSSSVWNNSSGASASSGITVPSSFIPNEWPIDDDLPDFDDEDDDEGC